MNAEGPVLRDIHVPPATWWPPAPGWWLLAALLLLVVAGVAWWVWRHALRRPLRAALREIDALEAAHVGDRDDARLADGASRLLRRVARRIDPIAASRTGAAWRAFVHGYAHDDATRQALDALTEARFRARPALDPPALLTALRGWCHAALRQRVTSPRRYASRAARALAFAPPFASKGANARVRHTQENAAP